VRVGTKSLHPNQKPIDLMRLIIEASTDVGDLVWEPFGGLCTGALAAFQLKRRCVSAEVNHEFFELAARRLHDAPAPSR
jgi:site-specific DNA-methyltransferase (adenine-specific)